MGWERKRGKLHELNRLLRGGTDTTFVASDGHAPAVPDGVRYVITLDADTRLPRGAARRMVGKMAHPLNAPRFDQQLGRVVEGHGVLQPRITASLPTGRDGSVFQRVFSSAAGIDPYAFAVSDVYQDLLDEGSYSGKGIYDVDVFEAALAGRVPDDTLLSHDLFEGTFARSGLVSDIELVEEFPSRYDVAAARQHRWARGDWQLLPWILGRAHGSDADSATSHARDGRSSIPPLGRWKMIDNLRRTLSAPITLAGAGRGMDAAAGGRRDVDRFHRRDDRDGADAPVRDRNHSAAPRHLQAQPYPRGRHRPRGGNVAARDDADAAGASGVADGRRNFANALPLVRESSADARVDDRGAGQADEASRRARILRDDGGRLVLAAAAAVFVAFEGHGGAMIAAPFVILWMLSPAIARWASLPPAIEGAKPLSLADATALRLTARRTWRFFEKFVTAEDNMLPPDNFQEDPKPVLAHRTSPTNIGLYLLSIVAAHDFGWIGTHETVERLGATLDTMKRMEQFRGHFYNWYGTRDLRPLDPKYVSSVDSGNLAGHLIALGNAFREMIARPVVDRNWLKGIEDSIALVRESLGALGADRRSHTVTPKQLEQVLDAMTPLIQSAPTTVRN